MFLIVEYHTAEDASIALDGGGAEDNLIFDSQEDAELYLAAYGNENMSYKIIEV